MSSAWAASGAAANSTVPTMAFKIFMISFSFVE
jgi:hypothetical protein